LIKPIIATLNLGYIIPAPAFFALRFVKSLSQIDRGAIAAYFG